ncbi:MAG: DUF58 domain-containing protein [Phycisphaerales bacterium]
MSSRDPSDEIPAPVRRYHFHLPGVVYVLVTLFIAVGAINGQNNLLFGALGLAMGGLLVSGLVSGAALMGVRVRRERSGPAAVGTPSVLRYAVANVNRFWPAFGLHVEEVPVGEQTRRGGVGAAFRSARTFVTHVAPRAASDAAAPLRPERRGVARLSAVRVWSTFPFGLARKSLTFELPHTVEVRPAALPLRPGLVQRLAARAAAGLGAERVVGAGDEFFGVREYVPGDSLRRIAWRATARTGALVVRQHAMPSPVRLWVVVRLGPTPDSPGGVARRERALALAGSLLAAGDDAGMSVGLAVPVVEVLLPPRAERRRLDRLLGVLARVELPAAAAPALAVERYPEAAARSARGAVCIVVHAGPVDRAFGPAHARHLSVAETDSWLDPTDEGRAMLARVDAASAAGGRRRARG